MRVLVVDYNRTDRDLATRIVTGAGHHAQSAADGRSAIALIEKACPEVVLLDWSAPQAADVLKTIRALEVTEHVYVIVTSSSQVGDLVNAINAGADDLTRKPLNKDELVVRIGAIERIRRWAVRVTTQGKVLDWSSGTNISKLRAWSDAAAAFSRDIEGVIGLPLTATRCEEPLEGIATGAEIPLTLTADQLHMRLVVGLDAASLTSIGCNLLGMEAPPPDALSDVVRELANTAGGAFKQCALEEDVTLTTGLPKDLPSPVAWPQANSAARQCLLLESADKSIRIGIQLDVRPTGLMRLNVCKLREGMVLARDLLNEAGALLVPAGTRLTSSQIERVGRVLSEFVMVDVLEAA